MEDKRAASLASDLLQLLKRVAGLWLIYIKGQFLMAAIVGATAWIVGQAIGLAWAFWLGALAGVLSLVPAVGQPVTSILAAIVAFWRGSSTLPLANWSFALIVLGVYVVIHQVANLIIEPHLVGKRLNLPALVVLLGVIAGAVLGNVLGAYLAVPLMVTLREVAIFIWRRWHGRSPFPEMESPPSH